MKNFLDKEKSKHYILYIIFGALTTMVDWGVYTLIRLVAPSVDENIANIVGIILSIIFAYFTNRKYVFRSKDKNMISEFIKFSGSRIFSLLFNIVAFWILVTLLKYNEYLSKALIAVVVVILNYIISRFFVFKKEDTDDKN